MPSHSLNAYVILKELIPTLYVDGNIPTNSERALVSLGEKIPPGTVDSVLLLEFQPDIYDPAGSSSTTITKFSKRITSTDQFHTVTIISGASIINLPVGKR